jgi:hypothetical protein
MASGEKSSDRTDFLSIADRMAVAIEAAVPIIQHMWGSFPYAELEGDDEAMTELRMAAKAWRDFQLDAMTVRPA